MGFRVFFSRESSCQKKKRVSELDATFKNVNNSSIALWSY